MTDTVWDPPTGEFPARLTPPLDPDTAGVRDFEPLVDAYPHDNFTSELAYDTADEVIEANTGRAMRAGLGFAAYTRRTYHSDEEIGVAFTDFLGDLMHLADALGIDFDTAVHRAAATYYGRELRNEP